jgi:hypothetical protein
VNQSNDCWPKSGLKSKFDRKVVSVESARKYKHKRNSPIVEYQSVKPFFFCCWRTAKKETAAGVATQRAESAQNKQFWSESDHKCSKQSRLEWPKSEKKPK